MPYILIFVIVSALLGMLIGLWKGARKKIAGIAATILSVIISLIIAPLIVKLAVTEETVHALIELAGFTAQYNELVAASPAVSELILGIPVALVAPLIFLPVYALFRLIFRIIAGAISKSLFTKNNWEISRTIGLPLGLVQGALSAMVFVVILAGLVSTVNNVTDTVLAQESEQLAEVQESVAEIDQYVNIFANDPIVKALDNTNFIYESLNSFKFADEKVVLKNEIKSITDAGINLLPLAENTEITTWSEAEFKALDAFVEKFGESKVLPEVSSEILAAACSKWADGEAFMGINPPRADDNINPLLVALYASFRNSTADTITVDMGTLVDILEIAGRHELLSGNTDNIMSKLSGTLITELLNVISTNERFSILIPEITNLSMRMLASTIKLPANVGEVYNNVTSSISTDLNAFLSGEKNEDAAKEFKASVTTSLKNNGIEVSEEVADLVADTMVTAFAEKETVTQEDVQKYFEDYANVYEAVENMQTNDSLSADGPVKLANTTKTGIASANYDYEKMSYDEKIAALASIGLLDFYQTKFDLSSAGNILSNGMTAEQFVNYILAIYNSVSENFEKISALGASETNPLISLKSAETVKTTKTTAEDLLVNTEEYQLNEKDIQNIAEGFENIASFVESFTAIEGSVSLDNIADLDLESVGKALDLLQDTDLLGDKIGAVADTLVSEMTGTDISISEKIESGDASFESLMTTVKNTSTVIGNLSNSDCTDEEKEAAILDLLLNITPETSDVISEIVTEDFMVQFGIPANYASVSAKALKIALIEMANLSEADHDVEAAKLKHLFELASSAGSTGKPMIGENGVFKSENDIIDMIVESKVAFATISSISTDKDGNFTKDALGIAKSMSASDKASLEKTITDYYKAEKATASASQLAELAQKLNMIATLFDLSITLK